MEDYYDEDLPEIKPSMVEFLAASKGALILAGKAISLPLGLFILTCVANYFINKKVESL